VSGEPTVARVKRRTPTAITDIEAQPAQAGDGLYYNLMGQPVAHPAAGIYIHNGKKVVVK
ncbi:MAG: peptidase M6, partial [Muribaculaceae bacterium]|nr:peptidase M6 [Muribaculaceae bacterium]